MSRSQKTIIVAMWILAGMAVSGVIAMRIVASNAKAVPAQVTRVGDDPFRNIAPDREPTSAEDLPNYFAAPDFTLTDQNGKPFHKADLLGHPWVADFIFTQCASLCPTMSTRMSALQQRLPASVKFVSFSVDPVNDTPAALLTYSQAYHAEPGRWTFLTGDLQTQTQVVKGMREYFEPAKADAPIMHTPRFLMVDAQGNVRGVYDSNDPDAIERLVHEMGLLTAAAPTTKP